MRLSVLDTSPIVSGSTAREALGNSVDLARWAERLGYHRYWVAEHHGMPGVASAAPAVLVGRLAAATSRIRVGAGGVLLRNHTPIVVAEQFGTLEALHPGRIDLGIGRSIGGRAQTADLVRGRSEPASASFPERLDELLGHFTQHTSRAIPAEGNAPPVWLLGSSEASARLAGPLGLPYAFAHHLNPDATAAALRSYRETFRPSRVACEPTALLSVSVIAADTEEHAEWLAGPSKLKFLARRSGRSILLPPPEQAAAYPYTDQERAAIDAQFATVLVGSPDTVRDRLRALAEDTGVDELMLTTRVHDHSDRRRSYQLIAEARPHPLTSTIVEDLASPS
ncbi:LLM class flavin-dependent oxidoreductase [Pseudonocardia acaciae]|uniref:LLM class flavin-dependent oxidoreductase n=1 Tax=Pseudonocardia acaciae TaxID=551276 RepID=UPI000687B4FA|nr:LLM class flavin-dependent oxidoreductase [Pseudonocardia acaciae]